MAPLRVLCLDIEGGFGGSSRSLYESLRHMDRGEVEPEVWCRRDGPIRPRYEAAGIKCVVTPGMPRMNSLSRLSRNIVDYAACVRDFMKWKKYRIELVGALNGRFDLIHYNHEGLFTLARWMRARHGKAQTMHVRSMLFDNAFSRWHVRQMAAANNRLVCITENESGVVDHLLGRPAGAAVIYNIAVPPDQKIKPHPAVPVDKRLKVAVLSNFALVRGTDRIIEIAAYLAARGRRDILFVMAGDMQMRGALPLELARTAKSGGTLADYAVSRGLGDMFLFLGHVADPESVLAGCDVLLKPTREDNPWGRDIIEALAAGKPVISVGRYDRFVETGKTGFLMSRYTDEGAADILLRLDSDRDLCRRLGENARARVAELCDGPSRAQDLLNLWRGAVANRKDSRARMSAAAIDARTFSPASYAKLIAALRERGYAPRGYADADPKAKHLIVRHDVDYSLDAANAMAKQESEIGFASTYFVLLRTEFYNLLSAEGLVALRSIASHGHTIGLHFDAALYSTDSKVLESAIAHECGLLETALGKPVTVLSFHRPAPQFVGAQDRIAGRINAYGQKFVREMGYCSDSRGAWHHGAPLDHPAVREGRGLQLLVHSFWWTEPMLPPEERLRRFIAERATFLDRELARHSNVHKPATSN